MNIDNVYTDSIRIGISNGVVLFQISPILNKFHENYPYIRQDLKVPGYNAVLNLFLENKLDILFYYKESMPQKEGINYIELKQDYLACMVPASHPFAAKKALSPDDLSNATTISCDTLNAPLSAINYQQNLLAHPFAHNTLYIDRIEITHRMVTAGIGLVILPEILCLRSSKLTVTLPLTERIPLSFGAFYYENNTSSALNKFIKVI